MYKTKLQAEAGEIVRIQERAAVGNYQNLFGKGTQENEMVCSSGAYWN
ncbi:MAG: hypothetical protein HFG80_08995 [Eubacterium sp.]|nr:hypothetical protein [Eubacterium sp.]